MATDAETPLPGNGQNFIATDNSHLDRSFLTADIDEVLKNLTVNEKISLLAGKDRWSTQDIQRLNIPSVIVTDGPNGARGSSYFKMTPAIAFPCGTALGATFSPTLIEEVGGLLAKETKARRSVCLLAPTINVPRNPLCGRVFEQFSEDPTHSGLIAAAYVKGLQSGGISPTMKHFVGNEQEHERNGCDSIIPPRALREVYLRPFQIAQKLSKPWGYMSSYNKVNGTHSSENKFLLRKVLQEEWGYGKDGFIMSDWWGTYSIDLAIKHGLSLEMPGGIGVFRQEALVLHMLKSHKLLASDIDLAAKSVLKWVQQLARLNEDIVYSPHLDEHTRPKTKEDVDIVNRSATESIVLLKNEDNILPINPLSKIKIGVIGSNAQDKVVTGGGSAKCRTSWCLSPLEGLQPHKGDKIEISYAVGNYAAKFLPLLDSNFTQLDGQAGFDIWHYAIQSDGTQAKEPMVKDRHDLSDMWMYDFYHPKLGKHWISELHAIFTSPIDGEYEFGMVITGKGWLFVDDKLIIESSTAESQKPGTAYVGFAAAEVTGIVAVKKGQKYKIRFLHDSRLPEGSDRGRGPIVRPGMRLGARPALSQETILSEAVELAKKVDKVILVVGLNADWESEGHDRPNLSLPPGTDNLIEKVAAVNPNTIVVIQTGSAISMPWLSKVKAVLYTWYLGNESGQAISDIIYGRVNPSGRLSITLPEKETDIPSFQDFKSSRTKVYYSEGIWMGYKHYNLRNINPLFPFGYGLSYTDFKYDNLTIKVNDGYKKADDWKLEVQVDVKNIGKVEGSHSVHVYLSPPKETDQSLKHPKYTLQGFTKVYGVKPGQSQKATINLDKYAISHWDELTDQWLVEQGEWTVQIGIDSRTFFGTETFTIDKELPWTGI